ncbi:hypothetical protein SAMN05518866_11017 [Sphingobium sp. YR768]|nr:hypothetical protein SAMN05518866_11017 [Sphingobium sp. YR768]
MAQIAVQIVTLSIAAVLTRVRPASYATERDEDGR